MRGRITEIVAKYKGHLELLFLPAILVLVGLSAFGLGRISAMGEEGRGLVIYGVEAQTAAAASAAESPQAKAYVASKSGTKYYLPSCSGAARIKEENKVWFATIAQAEAAGYTKASGCAGL